MFCQYPYATIREILGVMMKKNFLLYPVAGGAAGVKVLELLLNNDYRRFLGPPPKKKCWRATILEALVSTIRHGRNIPLIYISFLDYAFYKGF